MTHPDLVSLETPQGPISNIERRSTPIYRVGYAPNPWEWTPWQYATDGRFAGRWDDPDGVWCTVYCATSALACYLEPPLLPSRTRGATEPSFRSPPPQCRHGCPAAVLRSGNYP